ncbi:MAG: choice-of-anchor I family protein [Vicinamibacterales bacterium]
MLSRTLVGGVALTLTLVASAPAAPPLSLTRLGTGGTPTFRDADPRIAEINAYDPLGKRIYVVNPFDGRLDILGASNPSAPTQEGSVDMVLDCTTALGAECPLDAGIEPNSVAIHGSLMAVAVANPIRTSNGHAVFYRLRGANAPRFLKAVEVGALPDMITFTGDGRYALTANEGEPSADYTVDPLGSVSIIDVARMGVHVRRSLGFWYGFWSDWFRDGNDRDEDDDDWFWPRRHAAVRLVTFERFNDPDARAQLEAAGVRVFGPGASVAQDLEPEYITTLNDTAYVTLQENNALAIIDIDSARVQKVVALGRKNHSLPENELDPSDRDGAGNTALTKLGTWPVFGLYQPDGIDAFTVKGRTYLITANEGDAREYSAYVEAVRVGSASYVLDPTAFPNAVDLKKNTALARLNASKASGDTDGDGDFDRIDIFGGRSVSIRDHLGRLVWDSGDMFERLSEQQSGPGVTLFKTLFNTSSTENAADGRSDDKGVEPESVVVGRVGNRLYAFVALERDGGLAVLDVSDPTAPVFVTYVNNRKFPVDGAGKLLPCSANDCGDLGPEGLTFVPAAESPTGKPLLIISYEVTSTTTIWQIN